MADKQQETPEQPDPAEAEAKFWSTHEERTLGVLDKWFETKREELRQTATSRGDGRATLPTVIASWFFGSAKQS